MYCGYCGNQISENAYICVHCGALVKRAESKPKFYKSSFVLGILSLCIPPYSFILGIIGVILGILSKRLSSIVMSSIGIVVWTGLYTMLIFGASNA